MKKWSIGLILCFTGAQTMVKFYFQPASINWCETLKIWLFKAEKKEKLRKTSGENFKFSRPNKRHGSNETSGKKKNHTKLMFYSTSWVHTRTNDKQCIVLVARVNYNNNKKRKKNSNARVQQCRALQKCMRTKITERESKIKKETSKKKKYRVIIVLEWENIRRTAEIICQFV